MGYNAEDSRATYLKLIKEKLPNIKVTFEFVALDNFNNVLNSQLQAGQDPQKAVLLQEVYKNVGPFSTNWTSFFPMLVLATLPLVVFYLIMQKSIIEGVVAGSVKG